MANEILSFLSENKLSIIRSLMQINKGPTHSVVNIDFLAQRNYNLTSVLTFIFRKFTDVRDKI